MTRRIDVLRPEFVEFMPDQLAPGVLYISVQYKSIQHLCCCGCGRKVVTPLSPTGWHMTYDGRSVSLCPSVGNWQKECGSHYLIKQNRVVWARRWSQEEIAATLEHDREIKKEYYDEGARSKRGRPRSSPSVDAPKKRESKGTKRKLW